MHAFTESSQKKKKKTPLTMKIHSLGEEIKQE